MLATHRGFEYHTQQVEKSLERKNHEKDSHVCYRLFRLGPHRLVVLVLSTVSLSTSTVWALLARTSCMPDRV